MCSNARESVQRPQESLPMKITDLLVTPLPPLETPQQREARMAKFREQHPALIAALQRHGVPGYRSEANCYEQEGVEDDD